MAVWKNLKKVNELSWLVSRFSVYLCRTAVSRATSKLYEDIIKWRPDGDRHPPEWFSTKQCAAQYEHMLKTLSSRRKKRSERGGDQSSTSDSPADTLFQICYQGRLYQFSEPITVVHIVHIM